LSVPVVVFAYWIVALPLAYHWAFDEDCTTLCGDVGLVTGMTVGTWVHMVLLAVLVLSCTDWPAEALKAHARMMTASTTDALDES
jgi:Na+-driven multidrug efflux pump